MHKGWLLAGTAIATTLAAGTGVHSTQAADGSASGADRAVSDTNGKISAAAGAFNDDFAAIGQGSISLPLTQEWGLQIDGAAATLDDNGYGNAAAHVFWRDPARGLVGGYGSAIYYDAPGDNVWGGQIGAEAEGYFGRLTLRGMLGGEFGEDPLPDGVFALATAAYYPTDDLRLAGGYARAARIDFGLVEAEYQLSSLVPGLSTFAEARYGEDDNWSAWLGVRFYFGEPKSLIRRQREDDPAGNAGNTFFAYGSAFQGMDNPPSQPPCDDPEGYCTIT